MSKFRYRVLSTILTGIAAIGLLGACAPVAAPPAATVAPTTQAAPAAPTVALPTEVPAAPPATVPTEAARLSADELGNFKCPSKGGTFVHALAGNPAGIDPQTTSTSAQLQQVENQIFDQLITPPDLGKTDYKPYLATDWTVSPDSLTFTFNLREGVNFSDGTPFNSAAVKANVERIQNLKTAYAYPAFEGVTVETPSDQTVVFKRDSVRAVFMNDIANITFSQISPTVLAADPAAENVFAHPIGTGPYMFSERVVDDHITLVPNPKWWGGEVCLDKIVFRVVPEAATRVLELQSDSVQGINNVPTDQVNAISQNNTMFNRGACRVEGLSFNVSKPGPTSDPKFREAFRYAVNQPAILEGIDATGQYFVNTSWLSRNGWFYDPEVVNKYAFDLDKAKQLWDAAGYKDTDGDGILNDKSGQNITLDFPNGQFSELMAQIIQGELAKAGINLDLKLYEKDTYYNNYLFAGNYDVTIWNSASDTCDPSEMFEQLRSTNPENVPQIHDPKIDELIDAALKTTDLEQRKKLYQVVIDYIEPLNLYAFIGEKYPQDNSAVSKKVHGFAQDRYRVFKLDQVWMEQ